MEALHSPTTEQRLNPYDGTDLKGRTPPPIHGADLNTGRKPHVIYTELSAGLHIPDISQTHYFGIPIFIFQEAAGGAEFASQAHKVHLTQ